MVLQKAQVEIFDLVSDVKRHSPICEERPSEGAITVRADCKPAKYNVPLQSVIKVLLGTCMI